MNSEILFSESQRFTQKWLWIAIIIGFAIVFYGMIEQVFFGIPFGNRPMSNNGLIISNSIFILVGLLMMSMQLKTEIREGGIYYQLFPFHLKMKKIAFDDIEKIYVREYKPLMEYGGWGIRLGLFGKGWAINLSGNKGIQIEFKDKGKRKFLIGTQKSEEVEVVLGKLKNANI